MPPGTSSFTKNRDRLLEGEIAAKFLQAVLAQPRVKRLLSSDQFSVDGTLIEAWASIKSFRRKDGSDQDGDGPGGNAERNFRGEKRSNETHQSTTDPEAIHGGADPDATTIDFSWTGNDEMDEVSGDGSVELHPDGTLNGQIDFHNGDEILFTARRWTTSSTAC